MIDLTKAAKAMDRLPIIDRELIPHSSPEGTALAWTLNTEGPGAHKHGDGGSLFILSPVCPNGHVNQVVELEDYERLLCVMQQDRDDHAEQIKVQTERLDLARTQRDQALAKLAQFEEREAAAEYVRSIP